MGIAIKVAALRLASLSLALALFVFGSALSAQAYVDPPPNVLMDENGVNLANGSMHYQLFHTLPAVDPALPPFTRHWMGSGWRDSMMMTLTVDLSATVYTVGIGTSSQRFSTSNGTTFGAHDGATLAWDAATGHYLYTDSSGTIYHFDPAGFGSVQADHRVLARATRIVFPSGATITLTYQTNVFCTANCIYTTAARLQDVSSSNGFSFHFQYASDATGSGTAWAWQRLTKVTRYNRAVETCDPAANSCTFANPWPSIEYGESNVSNLWTETETNSAGETAQFVRMTRNYLISTRRPGSATNDMTVTLNSDLVGQIVRDGRTWVYNFVQTWACCGLWTMTATVSRPGGGQIQTVAYELSGLPISVRDEFGRTTYYTYDAMNLTDIAYPAGNAVHYTYDARSNQTSRTLVASIQGTPPDIVTSASFDPVCSNRVTCNRPNSTTDANQNTTDYAYDPVHGGVLTETLPAPTPGTVRPQTRYQYAQLQAYFKNSGGSIVASGVPTWLQTGSSRCRTLASCAGSADEAKTAIDFGPQSAGTANNLLPVASSAAAGDNSLVAATTTSYDPNGWRLTEDGPLAGAADTSRFRYDVIGRLIGIAGPDPDGAGSLPNRAVRTTYNADGRPTLVEQGTVAGQSDAAWAAFSSLQQQGIGYDAAGRKATETRASGGATFALTQFSYDAAGRPECAAVRMNAAAFGSLPASACTLGTTGSFGPDRIVRRSYDIAGRLLQLRSAVGTAEEGADETRTYTGSGMVETIADGEGNLTTYGYDGLDRLTTTWFPVAAQGAGASSTTDYELLGMDAAGNIVSRRRRDGTSIGYTYDALNRVIFKDIPAGAYWEFDITYTYDNLGHLLSAADPYVTMGHGYDALGRQVSESSNLGSETMSYDLAGRLTRLTWHDSFYVDYDHLVTGEVSAIRENGATSGIGVLATYGYDDRGRRTSLTRGNGTTTSYGYDNVDRLTRIVHDLSGTSYDLTLGDSYDPAGGIVSHTSSNDAYAWGGHYAVNRSYTANGLNQYTATGSITPTYDSRGNLISAGSTSYAYTSENRLATAGNIYLPYQADGRLWEIYSGSAGSIARLDYVGQQEIFELNAAGTIADRYVPGPSLDEPIVWYHGSGTSTRRWLHADERGSIVAVSDGSGAMFAINTYDEHGIPGAANAGRFQYTGQAWIPEIGMYYYRARIYSPSLGRFLQTDPIGYEAGMNLYAYVRDDPVNASDPTGTIRCNGDPRCPELHRRAWEARQIALAASAELRGLAGAVRGHAKLTPNQRSLLTAFQEKFGRAAARASGLEDAARFFDTVANRIGTEGSGMRANFDPTMRDPARRRSSATPSILGRRSSARQA